ncbi:MAG: hypothetical protein A2X86_20895 [Bdellovibrionales bacterium GWA2_49_15]|nr:MAG: hypothetical protein A2X86_20895 [Bdellovibrionales bacterium GWA2_49_15]HAZ14836.1 hypothetical protein [Bdellovibrionales bacterium]
MKKIGFIFIYLFFSVTLAEEVKQGLLNKLLAPGPLIEGHKNLEKVDCLSCHNAGKGVPSSQCLSCHKEIKQSIDRKKSFHGLASASKHCIECHSDHKGREFDSTLVDGEKFNHELTGHILYGKHKTIKCVDCHKDKRTKKAIRQDDVRFAGLIASCASCHKKQDVHLFKGEIATKDCNACHSEIKWKGTSNFDHFVSSKFKLEGKHVEMSCGKCHTPEGEKIGPAIYKWENLKTENCLSCHRPFHLGTLSQKYNDGQCSKCHEQGSWKIPTFKHAVTGLRINAKHLEITCVKCHKQAPLPAETSYKMLSGPTKVIPYQWKGLQAACISCHKDIHLFDRLTSTRFGKLSQCQACHNERSFKETPNFNHRLDTRFNVDGKHTELTCIKCHLNTDLANKESPRIYRFQELEKDNCAICHKGPHLKTFSQKNLLQKCVACHVTSSWKETRKAGKFNHNIDTRFPLEGAHIKTQCITCHKNEKNKIYKFRYDDKQFCEACHTNVHKKQFSEKFSSKSCMECHDSNAFKNLKKFDHSKTSFPLDGKHLDPKVSCEKCHRPTKEFITYKRINVRPKGIFQFYDDEKGLCEACHKNVHLNQFTKESLRKPCATCHTNQAFRPIKNIDHGTTSFLLIGQHKTTECTKCHVKTEEFFSNPPNNPIHKFIFDGMLTNNCKGCHKDVHKGDFGNSCTECHSEETKKWKVDQKFHKDFLLTGVHYTLRCDECHKDQRRLGGIGDACLLCHQKDDKHSGRLPYCKECHKQDFWEVTTFKHSLTAFPLRGSHRVLSCDQCHRDGVYQGKSSECVSCHYKDRSKSVILNHNLAGFEDCSACHNQFIFK